MTGRPEGEPRDIRFVGVFLYVAGMIGAAVAAGFIWEPLMCSLVCGIGAAGYGALMILDSRP